MVPGDCQHTCWYLAESRNATGRPPQRRPPAMSESTKGAEEKSCRAKRHMRGTICVLVVSFWASVVEAKLEGDGIGSTSAKSGAVYGSWAVGSVLTATYGRPLLFSVDLAEVLYTQQTNWYTVIYSTFDGPRHGPEVDQTSWRDVRNDCELIGYWQLCLISCRTNLNQRRDDNLTNTRSKSE